MHALCCSAGRKSWAGFGIGSAPVRVTATTLGGKVLELLVPLTRTVDEVKALIAEREHLPVGSLELILETTALDQGEQTLEQCGILASGAALTLVVWSTPKDSPRTVSSPPSSSLSEAFGACGAFDVEDPSPEGTELEEAFEKRDVERIVRLLSSRQPVSPQHDRRHPWAAHPTTVGALAASHLAIIASTSGDGLAIGSQSDKDRIREAGGIPAVVELLRDSEADRIQQAAVALNFLTMDNPRNAAAAYRAGAMELLFPCMASPVIGLRAASSTILRNMYCDSAALKQRFVDLGGIAGLVAQLTPVDSMLPAEYLHLEAILNLQDLFDDLDGPPPVEYVRQAIEAQAVERLEVLLAEVCDEEVRCAASEMLAQVRELSAECPLAVRGGHGGT